MKPEQGEGQNEELHMKKKTYQDGKPASPILYGQNDQDIQTFPLHTSGI